MSKLDKSSFIFIVCQAQLAWQYFFFKEGPCALVHCASSTVLCLCYVRLLIFFPICCHTQNNRDICGLKKEANWNTIAQLLTVRQRLTIENTANSPLSRYSRSDWSVLVNLGTSPLRYSSSSETASCLLKQYCNISPFSALLFWKIHVVCGAKMINIFANQTTFVVDLWFVCFMTI